MDYLQMHDEEHAETSVWMILPAIQIIGLSFAVSKEMKMKIIMFCTFKIIMTIRRKNALTMFLKAITIWGGWGTLLAKMSI